MDEEKKTKEEVIKIQGKVNIAKPAEERKRGKLQC